MNTEPVTFTDEQKAVLLALAIRWLETALATEKLAEEHPTKEGKIPLLRRAAHYRDCAVELQLVTYANSQIDKLKLEDNAVAETFYTLNIPGHNPAFDIQKFSAEGIGLARKLLDHLLEKGASWSEAEPELRRLFERISATSAE